MRITVLVLLASARVAAAGEIATEIPNVTAHLAYAHETDGLLRVAVALRNDTDRPIRHAKSVRYADAFIVDPSAKQKHFLLRDTAAAMLAGPISDANDGGRWFPALEPHSETLMWMLFPALPAGHRFELHVPLLPVFDDIAVEGSATARTVPCAVPPLTATLVSASRAHGKLTVELAIENPGTQLAGPSAAIMYKDVYALDPAAKQRYALVSDSAGMWLASPMSDANDHGRWFARLRGGERATMRLVFQAPPDAIKRVDLVVPMFAPIEAVELAGTSGAPDHGTPVTGESRDLDAALRELGAQVSAQGIAMQLSADLLFAFDRADITPAAEPALRDVARVLRAYPGAAVSIEGHADGSGAAAHNQRLSERRANAVAAWLAQQPGLEHVDATTRGWGSTKPIAPNTTEAGRAKNRRVEIAVSPRPRP